MSAPHIEAVGSGCLRAFAVWQLLINFLLTFATYAGIHRTFSLSVDVERSSTICLAIIGATVAIRMFFLSDLGRYLALPLNILFCVGFLLVLSDSIADFSLPIPARTYNNDDGPELFQIGRYVALWFSIITLAIALLTLLMTCGFIWVIVREHFRTKAWAAPKHSKRTHQSRSSDTS